jgi:flagellar basal-body rod protein FlgF
MRLGAGDIASQVPSSAADDPSCMERGLYIAASGMVAEMARQDQLANELANASTPGYKADRVAQKAFGDLLLSDTADGTVVGPLGSGAAVDKEQTDLRPQALRDTGEPLDLAIQGDGWFGVRTSSGIRYTRNGAFMADAKGNLVDQLGNQVLGKGNQPIKVANGAIDASKVAVFKVASPAKQGDSYFTGNASGQDTGEVRSGALEGSGVDPARAMVDLMASMRAMEATQKAITTIDSTLQLTSSQVGNLPG